MSDAASPSPGPGLLALGLLAGKLACRTPEPPEESDWFEGARWSRRLLVLTAEGSEAAAQRSLVAAEQEGLEERDLTVFVVGAEVEHVAGRRTTDLLPPATAFRQRFGLPDRGFQVVLIGKDGGVKLRRDEPLAPTDLWAVIDAMPMRMREMRRTGE